MAVSEASSATPNVTLDPDDLATAANLSVRYLNVTNELPIKYAQPLYGYVMPFLLVVTVIANTLIVVVLSKRHMRTPTNVVLMSMALSDMFTLLFPAPWLFYMYTFGNHYKPLSPPTACYAWYAMNEVIPALFHTASIWFTLALAVQRYIYVCHAPVARTWCTMSRVKKCIGWISVLAILSQATRFADREYLPVEFEWRGELAHGCRMEYSYLVTHVIPIDTYYTAYYGFRVVFVHMVPCISLVLLNLMLFRAMRIAQQKRERLFKENKKSECKRLRDSNCTTLMLIVVVTVFLLVEIPVAVVTVLHIISSGVTEILDYDVANALILFTNFFIIVSYPINFAIYCGMSRQFRETFKELFIRGVISSAVHGGTTVAERTQTGVALSCRAGSRKNGNNSKYSLVNGPKQACTTETVL